MRGDAREGDESARGVHEEVEEGDVPSRYMCAASRRRCARKKVFRAACRPSSTVGIIGSVDGSRRDVPPLVCMDNGSAASWVVVKFAGGSAAASESTSSDWKKRPLKAESVTGMGSSGRLAIAV